MCHLRDIDESVYYPRPLYLRMGCPLELAIRMRFIKKNLDYAHIRLHIYKSEKRMRKKSEWSTLKTSPASSPRTTPRKVRDDRGLMQKLFVVHIYKRVTQDNICNSLMFLQLSPSTYYFFGWMDGWMVDCQYIRNNLSLLHHQCFLLPL